MKSRTHRAVLRLVVFTGVSSVATQLLLLREYLALFQGNEYTIALILFHWLLLGALGSAATRYVSKRRFRVSPAVLGNLSALVAGVPAFSLIAVRAARAGLFTPGTSVGFYATFGFTLVTMAPYAVVIGFLLPYSLLVIREYRPEYPGARVYMVDNLGDALGGALFAFALVFWCTPVQAAAISGVPMLVTGCLLAVPVSRRPGWAALWGIAGGALIAVALIMEAPSLTVPYGRTVVTEESRYGRIQVVESGGQATVFKDGRPAAFGADPAGAEETVHFALSQLDSVDRVLLIGARSGMTAEIAKYRPSGVDYLELDPVFTKIQFDYGLVEKIDGLNPVHMDGRRFLARTDRRYSAVLLNLADPDTYQVNRFFTSEFFDLVRARLAPGGVLAFSLSGYANYLTEPQQQMVSCLYRTASAHFDRVLMLPGSRIHFLCRNGALSADIPARLFEKQITTLYLAGHFQGNTTRDRMAQLMSAVTPGTALNRDTDPYLMRLAFQQWFLKYGSSPVWLFVILALVVAGYYIAASREEMVLFSTGFTAMGSEILVIFAFQVFYGYVYFQIGAIVTAFLAGLLPGAWCGDRIGGKARQWLGVADLLMILLLAGFCAVLGRAGQGFPTTGYLGFGVLFSALCGFQFPLVLKAMGDDKRAVARTFSADLVGAGVGTLVTSVVLLPYAGFYGAAGGLILMKLGSLMQLARSKAGSDSCAL